jgi:hypothetical protein
MKAYGHSRRDKKTCKYGCCTNKSGKKSFRKEVDRTNRKTARRDGKCDVWAAYRDVE